MSFEEVWAWDAENPETLTGAADVFAKDTVVLQFAQAMVNNEALVNKDNYTITETNGSTELYIKSVNSTNQDATYVVFLTVNGMVDGVDYTITININDPLIQRTNGDPIPSGDATERFIGRRTKIDNYLEKSQIMYNLSRGTSIRTIMEAMMREDDLIGGERNDRIVSVAAASDIYVPDGIVDTWFTTAPTLTAALDYNIQPDLFWDVGEDDGSNHLNNLGIRAWTEAQGGDLQAGGSSVVFGQTNSKLNRSDLWQFTSVASTMTTYTGQSRPLQDETNSFIIMWIGYIDGAATDAAISGARHGIMGHKETGGNFYGYEMTRIKTSGNISFRQRTVSDINEDLITTVGSHEDQAMCIACVRDVAANTFSVYTWLDGKSATLQLVDGYSTLSTPGFHIGDTVSFWDGYIGYFAQGAFWEIDKATPTNFTRDNILALQEAMGA